MFYYNLRTHTGVQDVTPFFKLSIKNITIYTIIIIVDVNQSLDLLLEDKSV